MAVVKSKSKVPALLLPPYPFYLYFENGDELPFDPCATELSLPNAWRLAEAAQLAYEPPNLIHTTCALAGFDETTFFDNGSTQCFVALSGLSGTTTEDPSRSRSAALRKKPTFPAIPLPGMRRAPFAILSFRGTGLSSSDKLLDLLADISVGKTPFNNGQAHKGFASVLDLVWSGAMNPLGVSWAFTDGLGAYLDSLFLREPNLRLFVTGHSLGGALATLAAAKEHRCAALYTFGAPMAADESVLTDIACPHFRFTNGNDPVPSLPPPELMTKLFKYRYFHGGIHCHLEPDGRLSVGPEAPDSRTIADFISENMHRALEEFSDHLAPAKRLEHAKRAAARTPFVEDLNDHASVSYNARLWNLATDGPTVLA